MKRLTIIILVLSINSCAFQPIQTNCSGPDRIPILKPTIQSTIQSTIKPVLNGKPNQYVILVYRPNCDDANKIEAYVQEMAATVCGSGEFKGEYSTRTETHYEAENQSTKNYMKLEPINTRMLQAVIECGN